jgi:hypothetical protein
MSLEGIETRMLGIEHQPGEHGETEPGQIRAFLQRPDRRPRLDTSAALADAPVVPSSKYDPFMT